MDTSRINIVYRPLRIAWAIHSANPDAMRRALRLSHVLWGGRFNPIVFADRPDEARALIEVFRADFIFPLGDEPEVAAFRATFPHLISPFFGDELFLGSQGDSPRAQVLDVQNALSYWSTRPDWAAAKEHGFRRVQWDAADPLADALLAQHGDYPAVAEVGVDYDTLLFQATMAIEFKIGLDAPIDPESYRHFGVGFLSRYALHHHYSVRAGGWNQPGFFVGDATNIDDIVTFWNLRAADVAVSFIDVNHIARYEHVVPIVKQDYLARIANSPKYHDGLAIWSRHGVNFEAGRAALGADVNTNCRVSPDLWNGLNVVPPMMSFGEASSMGVLGQTRGQPTISFTLNEKPFASDSWFYNQHLVASLQIYGSPDELHTFKPPYVPELNETIARSMYGQYDALRLEPERFGIIIDANDHDLTIHALPVTELIEKIFALSSINAKPSDGGLITRQLMTRLGGVDGARAFKIPGVRRLLKTYGPNVAFSKHAALQAIGQTNPNTGGRFSDHTRLFIEPRPSSTALTPHMVFEHLVEKGLFRIGVELTCPSCSLPSWIALDNLQQRNTCELCGNSHDSTRQLVSTELKYRRTGILGRERNTQGAVPVALVLQQLGINLQGFGGLLLAPSYNLVPHPGVDLPVCETDIVGIYSRTYPDKVSFIIGECKDEGDRINQRDIDNLRRIADAINATRFETFIVLARLSPFSDEEISLARTLNGAFRQRVILLSARELEPYRIYERTNRETGLDLRGGSLRDLARATVQLYFNFTPPANNPTAQGNPNDA